MSVDPAPQIPHRASKGENTNTHRERKASPLAAPPSTVARKAGDTSSRKGVARDLRRNKSLQGINFDSPGDFQDKRMRKEQQAVIQGQHAARAQSRSTKYDSQQQLAIQFIRRREEACEWIGQVLAKSTSKRREKTVLPTTHNFAKILKSGIVLCELMQVINGERAENIVIHRQYPPTTREMAKEQLRTFMHSAWTWG